jgi:DNA ligase 1
MENYIEPDCTWAMLAVHFEDLEHIDFPRIGQPKLNGFRAKWDGEKLTSRQGKVWSPNAQPYIYEKLTAWSNRYPDVNLDGELYCHGLPFQEIEERCAVKRVKPHPDVQRIDFHAFDIISSDPTGVRMATLSQIYKPWVAVCRVDSKEDAFKWLHTFCEHGYEGIMLRATGCGYITNRTEALIKLKPMQYTHVWVTDTYEGKGKFEGMLGGFNVRMGTIEFNVGGGNISELERATIWKKRVHWKGQRILIGFRDTFTSGKPVQPQIVKLSC